MSHEPSHLTRQDFREPLAILQKLPLKCSPAQRGMRGPRRAHWAWAAMRGEQGLKALAEPRGDRPATSIPERCIYGVFSPVPVPGSLWPCWQRADLPARQALSMETQMPVSRARSTTEARSPLRSGTMEAVGENRHWGEAGPCSGSTLGGGQIRDVSSVLSWPCPPQFLLSGGCGDPSQQPVCCLPILAKHCAHAAPMGDP